MKQFYFFPILILILLLSSSQLFAQVPQGVNYQAAIRDNQGQPLIGQAATVRFTIHQTTASGFTVFQETHTTTTNQFGLVNLKIGAINTTAFPLINWSTGTYFLQVEVDAGSGFEDLGATQLLSVPYALYAESSGNGPQGLNSLMDTNSVLPVICPNGGKRVLMGLDTNANGVLDLPEITSSFVVCNGVDGLNGLSINWQGQVSTAPSTPNTNDAYYNTTDGISYIYSGATWDTLAASGTSSVDADWVINGVDMYADPAITGYVGIGTITPAFALDVVSSDSLIASFQGNNPNFSAISVSNTNPSGAAGVILLAGPDTAIFGFDPLQKMLVLDNSTTGGHIVLNADSTVTFSAMNVATDASDLIYNRTSRIYNETDTIYDYSTSGTIVHANQGMFLTDSLYVLGNNKDSVNYVLANDGTGQAKWTKTSALGIGGGAFTSNGTETTLNTITDNVGIGVIAPQSKLHVNSGDTIVALTEGSNAFGAFSVTKSLANGMVGELYITGSDTLFQTLDPIQNAFSINYIEPGSKIKLQADTVRFSVAGTSSVVTQNIGSFYNKDTIYTDGLYVNDNAGTLGNILSDIGGGRAQWTDPTTLGLGGSLWQSNGSDINYMTGRVGIGIASPVSSFNIIYSGTDTEANLINYTSTSAGGLGTGIYVNANNTGSGQISAGAFQVNASNGALTSIGLSANNIAGATTNYGFKTAVSGSGTTNYGIYAEVNGATTNWAAYFATGNVYIQDNVGIGVLSPSAKLDVAGTFKLKDGTEGIGKILTSDAAGNATWQTPASGSLWNLNGSDINYMVGKVGIGIASPVSSFNIIYSGTDTEASLVNYTSTSSVGTSTGLFVTADKMGGGSVYAGGFRINGATTAAEAVAVDAANYGNATINYGLRTAVSGSGTTNYGIYAEVNGATTNWAAYFATGNVYIQDNVGIGVLSPSAKLDVAGTFKLKDGTEGAGKILTSDAAGNATWQNFPPSVSFSANTSSTLIPAGLTTELIYDNVEYDSSGDFNIGTGQFVANVAGVYHVDAVVTFDASVPYEIQLQILRNGGTHKTVVVYADPLNNVTTAHISADVYVPILNTISIGIFQNSGGSISPSTALGISRVYFTGHLVR